MQAVCSRPTRLTSSSSPLSSNTTPVKPPLPPPPPSVTARLNIGLHSAKQHSSTTSSSTGSTAAISARDLCRHGNGNAAVVTTDTEQHPCDQSSSSSFFSTTSSPPPPHPHLVADNAAASVKYGELIIVGYNGALPQGDKGRIRSKFTLKKRPKASGVRPVKNHVIAGSPQQSELIKNNQQHSVSFTLSRSQAVIVQYDLDSNLDMFQIGRSSELPIDYVVMDTARGNKENQHIEKQLHQSTISRFACRILVEREPPFTARIYAAGFDSGKNIFLGEKATKWYAGGEIDGLTTNGVLISKPKPLNDTVHSSGFSNQNVAGIWREISVGGGVYAFRDGRSTPQKNSLVSDEDNILTDGTLIDLCGATLIWRSTTGLDISPSRSDLDIKIEEINASRPQCPVGLTTLVMPSRSAPNASHSADRQPHVYMGCGHVHGRHCWRQTDDEKSNRTCPMCLKMSTFTKLYMGIETSFYIDNNQPNYCFSPCGHMASENTVKYWSSIGIPQGCSGFQSICPFCSTPLSNTRGWIRLLFQDQCD